MSKITKIEWCDHTFNPWEGCTKVSPGCAHCYAEARHRRVAGGANWGAGAPRRRTSAANWRQPLKWNSQAGAGSREQGARRPRVFCASLADWLDDEVPIEWLADLLDLIRCTPNLDWLLLTKRPENWRRLLNDVDSVARYETQRAFHAGYHLRQWVEKWVIHQTPPANVWLGTSVENQKYADERIPLLLEIPARVRFLSCEPLLGPVDLLTPAFTGAGSFSAMEGIHWVICGGESGPKARPMHPDWARGLQSQCANARVRFFFKQWGEWIPRSQYCHAGTDVNPMALLKVTERSSAVMRRDGHIDGSLGPAFATNDDDGAIYRVGKHAAGRVLDGREWNEFPVSGLPSPAAHSGAQRSALSAQHPSDARP